MYAKSRDLYLKPYESEAEKILKKKRSEPRGIVTIEFARYYRNIPALGETPENESY